LHVLQQGELERIGGTQVLPLDVTVIAATNHKLGSDVREGKFHRTVVTAEYGDGVLAAAARA
jgi:transcriptional regulator with GAF, ATPase, and Fis domain